MIPGSKAVFIDRDGIIIRADSILDKPYPPSRMEDVEIITGSLLSFRRLADHGYILIGITNQPDVARGTQTQEMVEAINKLIQSSTPIREIFVCYHDDSNGCACRKPKPGLIFQAAQKYGLDLSQSWMIGDRWKDIAAGKAAGLKTIFMDYQYDELFNCAPADYTITDTSLLADIIIKNQYENT